MIAGLSVVLLIVNIWRRGWVLPVLAVGLWGFVAVVAGGIYPAVVQRFQVDPAESSREAALHRPQHRGHPGGHGPGRRQHAALRLQRGPHRRAAGRQRRRRSATSACWTPASCTDTYQQLQAERPFYRLDDLDVDRYEIDGRDDPGGDLGPRAEHLGHPAAVLGGPARRLHPRLRRGRRPGQRRHRARAGPDFVVDDIPVSSTADVAPGRPARHLRRRGPATATPSSAPPATRSTTRTPAARPSTSQLRGRRRRGHGLASCAGRPSPCASGRPSR